jgi:hypothetical protein
MFNYGQLELIKEIMSCRNPYVDLTVCNATEGIVILLPAPTTLVPLPRIQNGILSVLTLDLRDASQWCATVAPSLEIQVPPNTTGRLYANVTVKVVVSTADEPNVYTSESTTTVESRLVTSIATPIPQYNYYDLSPTWVVPAELRRGILNVTTYVSVLYDANTPLVFITGSVGAVASVARVLA